MTLAYQRETSVLIAMAVVLLLSAVAWSAEPETPEYRELDWVELIPDDDLQALLNPPQWLFDIEDGSSLDDPSMFESREQANEQDARYRQALQSSAVRGELAGTKVRVPGYIVPLAYDDQRRVIEFFLVPYMGACLHLPPPPPNQLIHVNYELGLEMDSLWEPYWVEGELQIKSVSNFTGESAYAIQPTKLEIYQF
ncbi:MAG: DUF3299 domain-containing protein [Gammaproteobacteria bacterium]|nr:DUF3299 domain-containing protein [Gammaproteobacteria bacterium]